MSNLIVWDIETIPDLKSFASANGHDGRNDDQVRAAMGDKFPKHIYHSIICIVSAGPAATRTATMATAPQPLIWINS
jgi:hypothetical protein